MISSITEYECMRREFFAVGFISQLVPKQFTNYFKYIGEAFLPAHFPLRKILFSTCSCLVSYSIDIARVTILFQSNVIFINVAWGPSVA